MKPTVVIIIAVGAGALSFFGGVQYQKSQSIAIGRSFMSGQQGIGRNGAGVVGNRKMGNGQPISGEIFNIDDSSITVKLADGSSRIVLFTDKTIFNKTATVQKSELQVGEKIGVFGTANTDGSVTAQNIQLNPQFRIGGATSGSAR